VFVSHLALTDFRSYAHVALDLSGGVTALIGPNGQGKTNLVEAVGYLAKLSSHRVATDAALVRVGQHQALIGARVERAGRTATVEVMITPGHPNRGRVNGGAPGRARDILGVLRTVQFAPEDLSLVKGDPDGRRRFLDELLVQMRPSLASVLVDYDRILRQRSALLKSAAGAARASGRLDVRTLDVWDAKLAATGARIVVARAQVTTALAPAVADAYAHVSASDGRAQIAYCPAVDSAPSGVIEDELVTENVELRLLDAMTRLRSREIERGVCLVGPHRDDVTLTLGDLPAKGYASHGESWSFALALRLASATLLRDGAGAGDWVADWGPDGDPVLILDDVFAELDVRRRDRLADLVAPAGQVLVTAAVPGDVPPGLLGTRLNVMDGQVTGVG